MQHDPRVPFHAGLLGFGLAGLSDGIVLHRILQWHHLLTDRLPDQGLRAHLLWDGAFDAVMFVTLASGLWGLCHHGGLGKGTGPTGRALAGWLLLGFGLWNVVDAVLVHWLLDLHRIRPEAQSPLTWD